ncbi:DUF932 domain-containing protein [Actinomycetospora straminea]|nr:DUF932 domain-containing protein [Actinomycetospora straminea]MDD7936742.1 DUF932 domain-containing protein [Actinomycetospora straminea]
MTGDEQGIGRVAQPERPHGNTDARGKAWHWRASAQGDEPNHYPGFVPVDDVLRRLFDWTAVELPVYVAVPGEGDESEYRALPGRKAIAADDTYEVLGLFKDGYAPHQYREWLLENVSTILDDDLGISSAGLLRNRAVAWVEVSVPDSITTPEGVAFRPNLLACTSFDGTVATTYKRTITNTVCDNTMGAALQEDGQQLKAKHTKNSGMKIADAREALAIVHTAADDFAAEVARLCDVTVTDAQWSQFLAGIAPDGDSKRSKTMAAEKRSQLDNLWRFDARVEPWSGSAWGALQAVNTWGQHIRGTRGATQRAERNAIETIDGSVEAADAEVLKVLAGISG